MVVPAPDPEERVLCVQLEVPASIEQVWQAWTTEAGARSFFAPDCRIDFRPDGAYEMLFDLEAAPGLQGGEGVRLLAIQPTSMLSFTWNAPPEIPSVRRQRTHVTLRLIALEPQRTRVRLTHDGWGTGEPWDRAFAYFERAWRRVVLPRLRYRFEHGPIDWAHPPTDLQPAASCGG